MLIFGLFGPYFEKTGEEEQFASTRPGGFAAGKNDFGRSFDNKNFLWL